MKNTLLKTSHVTAAFTLCALLGLTTTTAQAQVSGETACIKAGKPDLRFKPQSALGYFVAKKGSVEGQFWLSFFAEKLKPEEAWYWVASKALISA